MEEREYHWNIELRPYGPDGGVVCVDTARHYGYWERKDGSEGGGLWFDMADSSVDPLEYAGDPWPTEQLELIDYDGTSDYLPATVVRALRQAGFVVHSDINPDA